MPNRPHLKNELVYVFEFEWPLSSSNVQVLCMSKFMFYDILKLIAIFET